MYGDINFSLVGTVTQDREIMQLTNGQDRAVINVAVNTPRKNRDTGEYEEQTTWVRVALFGERVRSASVDKCVRGMPVYIRGTIQSYQQEIAGKNYTMYNFRPDIIRPLRSIEEVESGRERRASNANGPPPARAAAPARQPARQPAPENAGFGGDEFPAPDDSDNPFQD